MKQIYSTSKWFYLPTLLMYLAALVLAFVKYLSGAQVLEVFVSLIFLFGLISQIFMGFVHLVLALIVYYDHYKVVDSKLRFYLNAYSVVVLLFFGSWFLMYQSDSRIDFGVWLSFLLVLPMIIGGTFVYLMNIFNQAVTKN